jgi:type II secretory pathway pseudopilin PulG
MDVFAGVAVLIVIAAAIGVLCWLWMRSTRASQHRVEAQNQRVIELLEEIARNTGKD